MFEFEDKQKGRDIVRFVDTLCKETPEIALELLNVPIKRVGRWLTKKGQGDETYGSNGVGMAAVDIAKLPCGCLIGATFIATCRLYPEVVDSVAVTDDDDDIGGNSVVTNLPKALRVVDGNFGGFTTHEIRKIGLAVSDQVWGSQEREFSKFIKDRIRKNLSISEN